MRTLPIIPFILAAALVAGCDFPSGNSVPKEDYDAVVKAYDELKVSAEATRDSYIEQAAAVDNILQELSQVSGSTAVLRTDVEQGTARLNQVEMIENSIGEIKEKVVRKSSGPASSASSRTSCWPPSRPSSASCPAASPS